MEVLMYVFFSFQLLCGDSISVKAL